MLTLDDIFERLESMGYNQAAIARRLDTSEANVSRWRKGVHQPTPDVIESLAELARLSPAAVAVVIMASRAGKSRKAWEKAYGDLARAGLAAVVLAVGVGAPPAAEAQPGDMQSLYYGKRRRRRQEAVPPATRRLSQLSGWRHNHQSARHAYVIWGMRSLLGLPLRHLWHWHRGYSALRRESLTGASWPMLGSMPA